MLHEGRTDASRILAAFVSTDCRAGEMIKYRTPVGKALPGPESPYEGRMMITFDERKEALPQVNDTVLSGLEIEELLELWQDLGGGG